jgi:UTP--glucose-1-phosphate uridylyltransferase
MTSIDINHVSNQVTQKLNELHGTIPSSNTSYAKEFTDSMKTFQRMQQRFLDSLNNPDKHTIDWSRVESPTSETVRQYEEIEKKHANKLQDDSIVKSLLSKLVVLKLNGGLGTTMGCTGPKSVIQIKGDDSFLDLTIKQIEALNNKYGVNIPLVLMNSFNTHEETSKILPNYTQDRNVRVLTFNQKQYPRIRADNYLPVPATADPEKTDLGDWYPPGHGDIYDSFYRSDLYDQLVRRENREYMFMSNVDNLGATVDLTILSYLIDEQIDFCMEVTAKTLADIKGGTLIRYRQSSDDSIVKLLEIAQVPKQYVGEFQSIDKFKIFNTNNLWIRLAAIEENLDALNDQIEIINNRKEKDGIPVIQMETAAGAAIQVFKKAIGIEVPRSRFLPVKTCSDLLLIQSNVFVLNPSGDNSLIVNPKRSDNTVPLIQLSGQFQKVQDFNSRFQEIPDLLQCESLTVDGDVRFGKNVTVRGKVKISPPQPLTVHDQVLDNVTL